LPREHLTPAEYSRLLEKYEFDKFLSKKVEIRAKRAVVKEYCAGMIEPVDHWTRIHYPEAYEINMFRSKHIQKTIYDSLCALKKLLQWIEGKWGLSPKASESEKQKERDRAVSAFTVMIVDMYLKNEL